MHVNIVMKKTTILFVCLFISACAGIQHDPGDLSEIAPQPENDRNTFAEHGSVTENNPSDQQEQDISPPSIIENNKKDVALLNVEESEKNVAKEPLWPTETGYATYYAADRNRVRNILCSRYGRKLDGKWRTVRFRTAYRRASNNSNRQCSPRDKPGNTTACDCSNQ